MHVFVRPCAYVSSVAGTARSRTPRSPDGDAVRPRASRVFRVRGYNDFVSTVALLSVLSTLATVTHEHRHRASDPRYVKRGHRPRHV